MTSNLSAGSRVKALDFTRAYQVYNDETISNISSTSYAKGTPEVAVRIMAPSSGRVAVAIGAGTRNNAANNDRVFVTYQVFEDDPDNNDVVLGADLKRGVSTPGTFTDDFQSHGHVTMVDGLTPGVFYFFQVRHRSDTGAGTVDINHRHILVWPLP